MLGVMQLLGVPNRRQKKRGERGKKLKKFFLFLYINKKKSLSIEKKKRKQLEE